MKTRSILFILCACMTVISAYPQHTVYYRSLSSDVQQAKELYEKNDFIAAGELFATIAEKAEPGSAIHAEAIFYQALCGLKAEKGNAEREMRQYVERYPESPYRDQAWFELGNTFFREGRYKAMLDAFDKIRPSALPREDQIRITYEKGYAYFQQENYEEAEAEFARIKDTRSKNAAPAKYYWAHIQYLNEHFDEALTAFEQLKSNDAFKPYVPFYISHIYFKQGRYEEAVELAGPLLRTADEQQRTALFRLLGNSYFQMNRFGEAVPQFESWFRLTQSRPREETYRLGYCYYVTGRYSEAITSLEHASRGEDLLAQNAFYHLADCYIKTGSKDRARVAFEAAANMDFNAEIKEDALFNFAKITYELSYSPFNETINAFDRYIALYPNSERNQAAYDYLVGVYMSTNNFKDAVASIEKIRVKSPAVKKAWQRVTFYYGLELFNDLQYTPAAEYFNRSLENGSFDDRLQAGAIFWRAESMYHLQNYRLAIAGFRQFLNLPAARSLQEYKLAPYNLGYALFQVKDYEAAIASFGQFIAASQGQSSDKPADAYNRLADCFFIRRDYRNAVVNYEKAYQMNTYEPDYALYQRAICLGLQQEQQQKINSLKDFLSTFAESDLADDALYELGRTYERVGQDQVAMQCYGDLLGQYPQSSYRGKALLQLGLISYNQSDFNRSIAYYKKAAEEFPNSPEAKSALLGIKNNYIEINRPDDYFAYVKEIGAGTTVPVSEQDSLTYQAAEKLVMSGDPAARAALERYLQNYPEGSFRLNALFYLAESKYAAGAYSSALADYEEVLVTPGHLFTEQALLKAAELRFNAADYPKALSWYQQLEKISDAKWDQLKVRTGIMRCQFEMKNYPAAIEAAKMILTSENLPDVLKREATYKLAKSHYMSNSPEAALPLFRELAKDVKSAEGAESKYLMSEILVAQNQLSQAETEIMDFISKNTPHQFWLAKSFILLADIYQKKNDDFQAKHTLKSIVDNYPHNDDGIIMTAREKLEQMESREKQLRQKQDTPVQIDLNRQ